MASLITIRDNNGNIEVPSFRNPADKIKETTVSILGGTKEERTINFELSGNAVRYTAQELTVGQARINTAYAAEEIPAVALPLQLKVVR